MEFTSHVPGVQSHMLGHASRAGDSARFLFPFFSLIAGLDADKAGQRTAIMKQAPLHLHSLGIFSHFIPQFYTVYKVDWKYRFALLITEILTDGDQLSLPLSRRSDQKSILSSIIVHSIP